MEYHVGQILYLCNEEKMKIIPIQIVEEVIRTTLSGKEKNYIGMLPDKKRTKINVTDIQDSLYDSLNDVKSHMIKNATEAINRMGEMASMLEKEAFEIEKPIKKIDQKENSVQADSNNDIITVDLGNGVKAKMNTSILDKVAQ